MAGLKVYVDLMSQPARAILMFLKANNIPYEQKLVAIRKGEHKSEEYVKNVHRFGKIPAIDDNGTNIIESVAILRYLARKYNVADHWYPKDLKGQAKVDEYLEWQHLGCRMHVSGYFMIKFVKPLLTGEKPKETTLAASKQRMEEALADVENVWLKENPYLTGNKITIADLIGLCELEQPRITGFDPTVGRPKLAAWMNRVKQDMQPHYDDVHVIFNKALKMQSTL